MEAQGKTAVQDAFQRGDYTACLALARKWKQQLAAATEPNSEDLSLAHYYELNSLWWSRQAQETYRLLKEGSVFSLAWPADKLRDLYDLGVKASAQLGNVDDLVGWGQKSLVLAQLRHQPHEVASCALLVCHFLHEMQEDRRNLDFVRHLLTVAYQVGDDLHLFWGHYYMFAHVEQTQDSVLMKELIRALPVLVLLKDIAASESVDLVSQIRQSAWFVSMREEMAQTLSQPQEEGLAEAGMVPDLSNQSVPFRERRQPVFWS